MRHFYKTHGRHCYLRSFQTKCPKCGVDVLYWECTHGSKVFFEYPPYGKLVRHFCRRHLGRFNKRRNFPIVIKIPKGLLENSSPNCPICGKLFKCEKDLNNHLEALKRDDKPHKIFYENSFLFENSIRNNLGKNDQDKVYDQPKFGRINIKKKR
ncbi:MAG: hypothetical protein ACFFA6_14100 [Promethearchaeota archaeon]